MKIRCGPDSGMSPMASAAINIYKVLPLTNDSTSIYLLSTKMAASAANVHKKILAKCFLITWLTICSSKKWSGTVSATKSDNAASTINVTVTGSAPW